MSPLLRIVIIALCLVVAFIVLLVLALCRAAAHDPLAPSPDSRTTPLGVQSPRHPYPTVQNWRKL